MAKRPDDLPKSLVRAALDLCRAGMAGVTLHEGTPSGEQVFRWVALAGAYEAYEVAPRPPSSTVPDLPPAAGYCIMRS